MIAERSCGAVVYRSEQGERRYVIIRSTGGVYGFPKGHMERGENERETALREVREETGLRIRLFEGFRTTDRHPLYKRGKEELYKEIVYFAGTYEDQTPVPQEDEVDSVLLLPYGEAMKLFQFESSRRVLSEADRFLAENAAPKSV